ncbi:MAG: hypothetical protein Q4F99_01025, partial [bacterium]|nr:hypothetical protein [bacterium]
MKKMTLMAMVACFATFVFAQKSVEAPTPQAVTCKYCGKVKAPAPQAKAKAAKAPRVVVNSLQLTDAKAPAAPKCMKKMDGKGPHGRCLKKQGKGKGF